MESSPIYITRYSSHKLSDICIKWSKKGWIRGSAWIERLPSESKTQIIKR